MDLDLPVAAQAVQLFLHFVVKLDYIDFEPISESSFSILLVT
jgi:hypothetical protein